MNHNQSLFWTKKLFIYQSESKTREKNRNQSLIWTLNINLNQKTEPVLNIKYEPETETRAYSGQKNCVNINKKQKIIPVLDRKAV